MQWFCLVFFLFLSIHFTQATENTPFRILVETPKRGETHQQPTVKIKGYVFSDKGIKSLTVNNQSVDWREDGYFETTMKPQFGQNILSILVDDQQNAHHSYVSSFYHAKHFVPFDNNLNMQNPPSRQVIIQLDQQGAEHLLHDWNQKQVPTYVVEKLLKQSKKKIESSGVIQYNENLDLRLHSLQMKDVNVSLDFPANHSGFLIQYDSNARPVELGLDVFYAYKLFGLPIPILSNLFHVQFENISFVFELDYQKRSFKDSDLEVQAHRLDARLSELRISPLEKKAEDVGEQVWHSNLFLRLASYLMPSSLSDWFSWVLTKAVSPWKESLFYSHKNTTIYSGIQYVKNGLNPLLRSFALNWSFVGDRKPVSKEQPVLHFYFNLEKASTSKQLEMVWDTHLNTNLENANQTHRSHVPVIVRDGHAWVGNATSHSPLHLHVPIDTLNQALHSLWVGGMFDLEFPVTKDNSGFDPEEFHVSNVQVQLNPKLPPILNDKSAPATPLSLEMGHMEAAISFDFFKVKVRFLADIAIDARVGVHISERNLMFQIEQIRFAALDILEMENGSEEQMELYKGLINKYVIPKIESNVKNVPILSLGIPVIHLSQYTEWAPNGTSIDVHGFQVAYSPGFIHLFSEIN